MPAAYPVLLNVGARRCVIIGGGGVAVRKAKGLLSAGARHVAMVAPAFCSDVPEPVKKVHECYRPQHIDEAGIVFAATNVRAVNDAVVRDAGSRGIWVSRADGEEELAGDFVSAAQFQKGAVTVAISAASAALSVMIRDRLAARWEAGWSDMSQAMAQLRPEIKRRFNEPTRRAIFRDLATEQAIALLARGGIDGLRDWINRQYGAPGDAPPGAEREPGA
jgi:siroheme synthase-like protein